LNTNGLLQQAQETLLSSFVSRMNVTKLLINESQKSKENQLKIDEERKPRSSMSP
jgi:hypothetical protein